MHMKILFKLIKNVHLIVGYSVSSVPLVPIRAAVAYFREISLWGD